MTATQVTATQSFSVVLRERTASDHSGAEHSPFMKGLLGGELSREGYIDMLAQHYYTYEAIEGANARLADDEVAGPFVDSALDRLESLEADLTDLAGADWRDTYGPTEATNAYVARINECANDWPAGWVAHHYTRYLGDLSGGKFIGRVAARTYELSLDHGGRFAHFADIEDANAYKDAYRAKLDAAPWDDEEQIRVIDEIRAAYTFNNEVFISLGHHMEATS